MLVGFSFLAGMIGGCMTEYIVPFDSEKIKFAIEPELKKSGRAVVFGSDWERAYTKKTGNIFLYSSAPINQQLILSKTYVGYQGGLRLMEDIYNTMFEGKTITGKKKKKKLGS